MKRLIASKLKNWKNKSYRKPLILQGARQVGKTWCLKEFGETEFSNVHHLDFERNKDDFMQIFDDTLSSDKIISNISLVIEKEIDLEKDLLIFDEIQNIPRAITSLKYFCEDMPQLAICAAGSLLGINFSQESYPVGKVEYLTLHPMNFEEFLMNYGNKILYNAFLSGFNNKNITSVAHKKLLERLREFYVTGGMPEILKYFFENKVMKSNIYDKIRMMQKELLISYMKDLYKHSGKTNALHIDSVFNNIPMQLAESVDNSTKRYKFKGVVRGKKGYADLQGPIDWLLKAGLINKVNISNRAELPLKAFSKENAFKLYLFDIGLLGAMLELTPSLILLGNYAITKGFFIENFAITEIKSISTKELYSWNERNSEIEIITDNNSSILPIEIKSGLRTKAKSLQQFILKYAPEKAYILSEKMFSTQKQLKENIPLYYIAKLWSSFN